MPTPIGYFAIVLHTHIPYVLSHGRWPHGTDWLCEAVVESYIPLLRVFHRLAQKGIKPNVTFSITPITCEQLRDPSFPSELRDYIQNKIETSREAEKEWRRQGDEYLASLCAKWRDFYLSSLKTFEEEFEGDLVAQLKKLQDEGQIEIMTSAATHGYLPLLLLDESVQTQIKLGVDAYRYHFQRQPKGIWLPECAYRPRYEWQAPLIDYKYLRKGIDEFLSEVGLKYFIVDSHLLKGGKVVGVYLDRFPALRELWERLEKRERPEEGEKHLYQTYLVDSSGEGEEPVAVFARDPETGVQVWSGQVGYPGDGYYLEFHKKHFPGGFRLWRVTHSQADLALKEPYIPHKAKERVEEHARHFLSLIKEVLMRFKKETGIRGIITAPYDTELFGHWWYEGPRFLERVIESIKEDGEIELVTCGDYLERFPPDTIISLPEGSWGEGGFHWIWLNEWTEWTWRHIYSAEQEMRELVRMVDPVDERQREIFLQAGRELLLLQSSDWQFLISTWTARDYAELRVAEHYNSFRRLAQMLRDLSAGKEVDPSAWRFLEYCKERDRVFPYLDITHLGELDFPPYKPPRSAKEENL